MEESTQVAAQPQEAALAMARAHQETLSPLSVTPTTSTALATRALPTGPLTLALEAATLAGTPRAVSMMLLVVQWMTGATLRRPLMPSSLVAKLAHTPSKVIDLVISSPGVFG